MGPSAPPHGTTQVHCQRWHSFSPPSWCDSQGPSHLQDLSAKANSLKSCHGDLRPLAQRKGAHAVLLQEMHLDHNAHGLSYGRHTASGWTEICGDAIHVDGGMHAGVPIWLRVPAPSVDTPSGHPATDELLPGTAFPCCMAGWWLPGSGRSSTGSSPSRSTHLLVGPVTHVTASSSSIHLDSGSQALGRRPPRPPSFLADGLNMCLLPSDCSEGARPDAPTVIEA